MKVKRFFVLFVVLFILEIIPASYGTDDKKKLVSPPLNVFDSQLEEFILNMNIMDPTEMNNLILFYFGEKELSSYAGYDTWTDEQKADYMNALQSIVAESHGIPFDKHIALWTYNGSDFQNFVQNTMYPSGDVSELTKENADIFAEAIGWAMNQAINEYNSEKSTQLSSVETYITEDMRFAVYLTSGEAFFIPTCGTMESVGHLFLHMFCSFDRSPPSDPNDHDDGHCIDYSHPDLIVPGSVDGFSINLTKETLTMPEDYTPRAYSIDGGNKWRPVKDKLSEKKFPRLFSRDMKLVLSDTLPDKKTKKPPEDARITEFPEILKRPKVPRLYFNYQIGEDKTGDTLGEWVLTEKNGTVAVKEGIQLGVADPAKKNKVVNIRGYGHFYEGKTNGICIKPLLKYKVQKTTYFYRLAPQKEDDTYTAASKPKRIKAHGAQKMTRFKVKTKKERKNKDGTIKTPKTETIAVRKGTYVKMNGEVKFYAEKTVLDVLEYNGIIELWTAAKVKKPVGTKQRIDRIRW